MSRSTLLTAILLSTAVLASADSDVRRYLYMSTPDGAQKEGRAEGNGILVFDIDDGHKLVRRIDVPIFEEGLRGFAGNLKTGYAYYSSTNRTLGAYDLVNEKKVWEVKLPAGADRSSVTMDGKKIYVPTGWWYSGADSGLIVVNGENGEVIRRLNVGPQAHNSIMSLTRDRLYLGTRTTLSVFDTNSDEMMMQIKDVGERGIFPFTINSAETLAYVCLGDHIGFDVVDLVEGKAIHRVYAGEEMMENRTHGVGLTPDETELWISDQKGQHLYIFDATKMPPVQTAHVELSQGGHGWVGFSLDGKYAWSHTPDIFDVKTKKVVGTFRDESGKPISGSKYVEVHFRDGKIVAMSNEFGLGRK